MYIKNVLYLHTEICINIKKMKITKFEHIRHIVPDGSCGTGYSEPDEFEVEYETEDEVSFKTILIDIWYSPCDHIKEIFLQAMKHYFEEEIENLEEAFEMYTKQVAEQCCPYTFEDITDFN